MRLIAIVISIHFLAASLLTNNEFSGLLRIGNLVSHFYHHVNDHGENISFTTFLAMHYWNHDHLHTDHDEHGDLPLHQHGAECSSSSFILTFSSPFIHTDPSFPTPSEKGKAVYIEKLFIAPLIDIWQPPRLA